MQVVSGALVDWLGATSTNQVEFVSHKVPLCWRWKTFSFLSAIQGFALR